MKTSDAYKTIGEVAELLKIPQHILRFWEQSFSQVKPLKRKGGRRLYSENDINLLRRIKILLHDEGYSIKGVKGYLSKNKIENIKIEGKLKVSDEVILKLEQIVENLTKIRNFLC